MTIRAIIFDMDGTLADSIGHYYEVACEITDLVEAPRVSREFVCELMSQGDPNLVPKLLPADFPEIHRALERIREHFRTRRSFAREFKPLPGSIETLRQLHEAEFSLAIATSANRTLPSLDQWRVRDLFSSIVGREDVEKKKPHPESLHRCLEQLEVDPREALFVGDSEVDMLAGQRANIATVGVLSGTSSAEHLRSAGADALLESVADLPRWLDHSGNAATDR